MDVGGLSLLLYTKANLVGKRDLHLQWSSDFIDTIDYNLILEICVWNDDDILTHLQIRASPETTQAAHTVACDLLLPCMTTWKRISHVYLSRGSSLQSNHPPVHSLVWLYPDSSHKAIRQSSCFDTFEFNEDHCRALVATEAYRDNFAITLQSCRLTTEGEPILFDGIRRNRGPTSLSQCHFSTRPLAEALRGNTRIKQLSISLQITGEELPFLMQALVKNLGIEEINLVGIVTDECWRIICQSLATHPALERLFLHNMTSSHDAEVMSEARKTHRTLCLVEMLKANTVVTDINKRDFQFDETIWRDEIKPQLEMNRICRPRIVAVKKTQGTLRAPLFARALHTIRANNTFLFMMVKGNVDIFDELARVRTRMCRKRTRYGK